MPQEVVLIIGFPAAGKTRYVENFTKGGHVRLNRDLAGGSVNDLLIPAKKALQAGQSVVLDNLYATAASRRPFIALAQEHGVPIRCVWVNTSLEDAQFNACLRMVERAGKILDPKEKTSDPNLFPMAVIYKYRKEFEQPTTGEGFDLITVEKFKREYPADWTNEAIIYDYDGTLRSHTGSLKFPTTKEEIYILPGRKEKVQALAAEGKTQLGVSNQSGVAKGDLTVELAQELFNHTNKLLGADIDVKFCPHKVPPISCYCRKPGTGLAVEHIVKYKLDPRKCTYVGDLGTDESFAKRAGFTFVPAEKFFR